MKKSILYFFLFFTITTYSQKILTVKNAIVLFEASVPFFEPVAAKNEVVQVALNTKKGYISFEIPMKKFQFERSLMEEHFNDNYLETKRYPTATFKGLIEKFDLQVIFKTAKFFLIKGEITIHGKSKNITVAANLKKTKEGITLLSDFQLYTDDYDIEIPFLISNKISKTVNVTVNAFFLTKSTELSTLAISTKP
ncbi:YceI family protein [Flavobacterium ovatum]|uniref:YceI family protein n=1 Tax=Flavobacterium ovatum TaxID=1928857 RepID=UPI00344D0016